MNSKLLAAALLLFVLAACSSATGDETPPLTSSTTGEAAAQPHSSIGKEPKAGGGGIPAQIRFASSVGEVVFQHEMHFKDRGIACVQCHHQINAKKLSTPHPDYLKSSTVNCQICHKEFAETRYSCSQCHDAKRRDIADETLSAKVVVHKQCQTCHSVGTGKDASSACALCHGPQKP
jgi:uncharacterized CHY-type Zn-finger protein